MRTTIRLDRQLLIQAKQLAAERGTTLTALISDSLRETVSRRQAARRPRRFRLPTWGHGGVFPGVDIDDSAALLDRMEGIHVPR
jgi:hypothetical protein